MKPEDDPLTLPPTIVRLHTRAWNLDLARYRAGAQIADDQETAICRWLVEAPWAHPMWHSYLIGVVHLRELRDIPSAHVRVPGATHEIFVLALDPDYPRETTALDGQPRHLQPINFSGQFIAVDDPTAEELARATVEDVCDGRLSPDTDFLSEWKKRFPEEY